MKPSIARKRASAVLAIELQQRVQNLQEALTKDEQAQAAFDLGKLFNDNLPFIVWVLKHHGGLNPPPYVPGN